MQMNEDTLRLLCYNLFHTVYLGCKWGSLTYIGTGEDHEMATEQSQMLWNIFPSDKVSEKLVFCRCNEASEVEVMLEELKRRRQDEVEVIVILGVLTNFVECWICVIFSLI